MRAFARQMTERMKAVAAGGAVAAFWLAVWMLVAALVAQPLILPGPGAVALALLRLVCDGGTWAILAGSGARILGGLALAAVCGGVLAGVSVRSRAFARLVAPALSFVKATPVACVVVLLLIWLGSARVSIAAVFLMALPGVYFSLAEGLAQANKPLEQMFRLHGVRGWRLFCAHTWREVLPFVLSCARAVIGMSWKAGVAAELIGMATDTVGEHIYQAKLLIETADLLVPGVDVHARVAELSGGQRRRVEMARALLCGGCAVILDEPFTGLDASARDATAEAVLDLLDGRMLLLATHDVADAQALDISDIITL